jgi:OmpA-OmpF porin, OOP family
MKIVARISFHSKKINKGINKSKEGVFMKHGKILAVLVALVFVFSALGNAMAAKTDNFVLLIDQSAEMQGKYQGKSKQLHARETAKRFIEKVPTDIPVQGAIYMYGIMAAENDHKIKKIKGFTPFNRPGFKKALDGVKAQSGPSSLSIALKQAKKDMVKKGVSGRTAVIIISGGNFSDVGEPGTEASKLKKKFGDDVCIYTIYIGKSEKGGKNLKELKKKGKCGVKKSLTGVNTSKEMQNFSDDIFFGTKNDSDRDGVKNKVDQCPGTPDGANVDSRGCWAIYDVNFDSGKSVIKPQYYGILEEIIEVMNVDPDVKIQIDGHTDSQGDDAYNQKLSQQRADAVMNYLTTNGVSAFRLRAIGRGEGQPIGDNSTSQGRALNRRIEFVVSK